MKRHFKSSILGVTLLEIMLVLAIAAMVIVMSVRYYQSANASSQANATMGMIQAITAAAESLSQSSGSYVDANTSQLQTLIGTSALKLPWGTANSVTITGAPGGYTVTIPSAPAAVCALVSNKLKPNLEHFSVSSSCGTVAEFKYVYTP